MSSRLTKRAIQKAARLPTCEDHLNEVAVLQLAALPQPEQKLLRGGLMSEQQNLLPRPHQAEVWGLNTGRCERNRKSTRMCGLSQTRLTYAPGL